MSNYQAKIHVTLKKSVLDPQGKAILKAIRSLGFEEAREVRVGKFFEVKLDGGDKKALEDKIHSMCDRLLANLVIEEYSFQVEEVSPP